MTTLIADAGPTAADATVTRIGGVPLAPPGTEWPSCDACAGPMKFLAQILLDESGAAVAGGDGQQARVLALFTCQNHPGSCRDWEARSGANRALRLPARSLRPLPRPAIGEDGNGNEGEGVDGEAADEVLLLGAARAVGGAAPQILSEAADHDSARTAWAAQTGRPGKHVLGQLGGAPAWLQYDETPARLNCAEPMRLAVQLQEGPHLVTAMNFGGGRAYAFTRGPCADAAFPWQCRAGGRRTPEVRRAVLGGRCPLRYGQADVGVSPAMRLSGMSMLCPWLWTRTLPSVLEPRVPQSVPADVETCTNCSGGAGGVGHHEAAAAVETNTTARNVRVSPLRSRRAARSTPVLPSGQASAPAADAGSGQATRATRYVAQQATASATRIRTPASTSMPRGAGELLPLLRTPQIPMNPKTAS